MKRGKTCYTSRFFQISGGSLQLPPNATGLSQVTLWLRGSAIRTQGTGIISVFLRNIPSAIVHAWLQALILKLLQRVQSNATGAANSPDCVSYQDPAGSFG